MSPTLRRYHLYSSSPARPDAVLRFDWDIGAGTVSGPDAEQVQGLCAAAVQEGGVTGHPYPTFHKVFDPLRSLRNMAVVLGQRWRLDAELAAAYPWPDPAGPDAGEVLITF